MIRGISRCLQYRKCFPERFIRDHWSKPSSSQPTETAVPVVQPIGNQVEGEQPRDSDFAASFQKMLPSQQFRDGLPESEKKRLDLLIKQTELYCYMARKVPTFLRDEDWNTLLDIPAVQKRVEHLEFIAVREYREERDRLKASENTYNKFTEQEMKRYKEGEMAYGPNMYEMVSNPLRRKSRVNLTSGAHVWSSLRLKEEYPTVVLDMQFVYDGKHKIEASKIKKQMMYCLSENFYSRRPLPLVLAHVPENETYTEKCLGFWSTEYQNQMILPDREKVSPREAAIKATGKKNPNIVYISRYAKKMLDGPLNADAYVIPVTFDQKRESIMAAQNQKIEAYRYPIHKYCAWQGGTMAFPVTVQMQILRDVIKNGGDWKSAFYANISKRHLEERDEEKAAKNQMKRRAMGNEREQIIQSIIESCGSE